MRAVIVFLFSMVMLCATEKSEIDSKITQIELATPPSLPIFKNPFVHQRVVSPIKYHHRMNGKLELAAVVANSANISNGWYKVKDMVAGWEVDAIFLNFVVLKKGVQELRLYIDENRYNNINIVKVSGQ